MGFLYSQLFVTPSYPTGSFLGQTIIVTGSNTGLGKEAARHFARLGVSKLILAVRNTTAGAAAKTDIEATTKCDQSIIEVWKLDLGSYQSVKTFAERASKLPRIDVLLENAGIVPYNYVLLEGYESTITVNVISTFLLGLLLLPKLKDTAKTFKTQPRLAIVSSETHGFTKFSERKAPVIFDTFNDASRFKPSDRYPVSKLLEILTVRRIAPKLATSGVILNCLNPGLCHSELSREAPALQARVLKFLLARPTEVGSRTLLASASAGIESHGKYMSDGKVDEEALSKFVRSPDGAKAAERVWNELSSILEGIQPGITGNLEG